jgi:glycerate-2-kinase
MIDLEKIFKKALEEVRPSKLLEEVELPKEKFHIFGVGKASIEMAEVIVERAEVYSVNLISNSEREDFEVLKGDHPIPAENSISSTKALLEKMESVEGRYLFLLSGGASAMFELPEDGISLKDLQKSYKLLLSNPLSIDEVNCVRKAISKVKGGKTLNFLKAEGEVLVLSDVFGDDFSVVGSGPLFAKECDNPKEILQRFRIFEKFPDSVKKVLEGKKVESFQNPKHTLIGGNRIFLNALSKIGKAEGLETEICGVDFRGEAREIGKFIVSIAKAKLEKVSKPTLLIFGGESSVTVRGKGIGGRNHEIGLSALIELRESSGITILASGTDGKDGTSSATGVLLNSESYKFAKLLHLNLHNYLNWNDSGTLFQLIGGSIFTKSGTNVMDTILILLEP